MCLLLSLHQQRHQHYKDNEHTPIQEDQVLDLLKKGTGFSNPEKTKSAGGPSYYGREPS